MAEFWRRVTGWKVKCYKPDGGRWGTPGSGVSSWFGRHRAVTAWAFRGGTWLYTAGKSSPFRHKISIISYSFPRRKAPELKLKEHFGYCLFFSFFFLIFIVIQLQLYAFSPHPSTPPQAAERKKELIPFATAWMKLESIMATVFSHWPIAYHYNFMVK